jgi:hypothetical protein
MQTGQEILIVYGAISLMYGFVLGIPLSRIRMRQPEAPRYLVVAHLSAIIQGGVHLALSIALGFADMTPLLTTLSAALLISGSALFVSGATLDWLQRVGDHFAERSLGWRLLAASGPVHISGMAIVTAGVLTSI